MGPYRRGLRPREIPLLVGIVLLLVANGVLGVVRYQEIAEARFQRRLAEEVPVLKAFVERTRGLRFKAPVPMRFLDDEDFLDAYVDGGEETASGTDEIEYDVAKTLSALHLIEDPDDFYADADTAVAEGVVGFYDPERDALFVRGRRLTSFTRLVIVHELVHALQDQHFDIHRPEYDTYDDEHIPAWRALVEGDAVRVEQAYRASLTAEERSRLDREEASAFGGLSPDVPDVLYALLGFPYEVGPPFVEAVVDAAGQARLDRAFAAPPTSSEQVLHPEAYLKGDAPDEVATPTVAGRMVDRGAIGELGFILMLGEGSPDLVNDAAVVGWGGDRYATYVEGQRPCVLADVVMDTAKDRDELFAALTTWGAKHTGTQVTRTSARALRLRTCA